jgi:hypothetical protein
LLAKICFRPRRAAGAAPHSRSLASLRKVRVVYENGLAGRKLIGTPIVRSHAVCAARDDSNCALPFALSLANLPHRTRRL